MERGLFEKEQCAIMEETLGALLYGTNQDRKIFENYPYREKVHTTAGRRKLGDLRKDGIQMGDGQRTARSRFDDAALRSARHQRE